MARSFAFVARKRAIILHVENIRLIITEKEARDPSFGYS